MDLEPTDQLIAARMAAESTQVILVSSEGQAIVFKIDDLRQASRTSGGVRGMKLAKGGYVVGVETLDDGEQLLIISEKGFGKRTRLSEYPVQGRGGQGVKTLNITDRTGNVAACRVVEPGQDLMLVTRDGIVVRTRVDSISLIGRNTQGVTVMKVNEGDQVASIAAFTMSDPVEGRDVTDVSANANGAHDDDEQVLNETIPLELDEEE
ncbi:DNA gyrase C-terminal beta-propeller domain-containing protein [Candidatus Amarobacter glycogenicus]